MCSKPIFAKAKKSARFCSRPRQTKLSVKRKTPAKLSAIVQPYENSQHTVLLFEHATTPARICCAPKESVLAHLRVPQGVHLEQLHKVFSQGSVCHYEWNWEDIGWHTCRTTLLPLIGPMGQVEEVMSITQDISQWADGPHSSQVLHEGKAPKTFAQILLSARETEKRELAKALHDEIGTASVMLSALVNLAKQSVRKGDAKQVLADLDRLQTQTQQSMERLRTIIVTLRPPSLDTDGALRGSIQTLIADVCKLGRLSYRFECAQTMPEKGICDAVKIALYRLVQEALNNVVKHAHAKQVEITLKRVKGQMFLTVQDDGVGFVRSKGNSIHHVGLLAMKNSILSLGGRLTISSKPGKGTRIAAVCPCIVYEEK